MIFKYDSYGKLIDETRIINVEQNINPFTMKKILTIEDAYNWMRDFLSFELNAQPLFFNVSITDDETGEYIKELIQDKKYTFSIKESFGKLTGKYIISIKNNGTNQKINIKVSFFDGQCKFDYSFNSIGEYTILLDNDFFIGTNKYISIVNETNTMNFSVIDNF